MKIDELIQLLENADDIEGVAKLITGLAAAKEGDMAAMADQLTDEHLERLEKAIPDPEFKTLLRSIRAANLWKRAGSPRVEEHGLDEHANLIMDTAVRRMGFASMLLELKLTVVLTPLVQYLTWLAYNHGLEDGRAETNSEKEEGCNDPKV